MWTTEDAEGTEKPFAHQPAWCASVALTPALSRCGRRGGLSGLCQYADDLRASICSMSPLRDLRVALLIFAFQTTTAGRTPCDPTTSALQSVPCLRFTSSVSPS